MIALLHYSNRSEQSGLMMPDAGTNWQSLPQRSPSPNARWMKLQRARQRQMKGKQKSEMQTKPNCLPEKIPSLCCLSHQYYRCQFGLLPFWICCPFHNMLIVLMAIPYLSYVKMEKVHRAHGRLMNRHLRIPVFIAPMLQLILNSLQLSHSTWISVSTGTLQ